VPLNRFVPARWESTHCSLKQFLCCTDVLQSWRCTFSQLSPAEQPWMAFVPYCWNLRHGSRWSISHLRRPPDAFLPVTPCGHCPITSFGQSTGFLGALLVFGVGVPVPISVTGASRMVVLLITVLADSFSRSKSGSGSCACTCSC